MKKLLFLAFVITASNAKAQNPCTSPKVHEFDFWIGKWTVYKNGTDTIVGYNEIKTVADGCSLLESCRSAKSNYKGNSLNKYNAVTGKWQQFWVDNGGLTLFIEGGYQDNRLTMENEDKNADGSVTRNRI